MSGQLVQRYESIFNQRHRIAVVAIAAALLVYLTCIEIFWIDLFNSSLPLPLLLLSAVWVRDRRFLWGATLVLLIANFLPVIVTPIPPGLPHSIFFARLGNRIVSGATIVGAAIALQILLRAWFVAQQNRNQLVEEHQRLEQSHEELASREEEISQQNEELQSQTEELERQSEELRVANEELARREQMLEALLRLSRSLMSELSTGEMMTRVCEALSSLVDGRSAGAAILEREGEEFVVRCHHGFGPDGATFDRIAVDKAFASLVIERGKTGFLEDVALRPDLQIPQPATSSGPKFKSVLAAPLRVAGKPSGSLEVYSPEPRRWSDEQIALVESLAAQASISLEAAALFEDVKQQQQRLAAVVQTVPVGIGICNREATEVRLNPAGAAMLGLPANATIAPTGAGRFTLYREGVAVASEQVPIVRALCGGVETHAQEYEMVLTSGKRLSVLIGASPFHGADGKIDGAVTAFVDITTQKNLQRELDARRREAEEVSARKTRFLSTVAHDIRTPANAIGLLGELLQRASTNPALAKETPELARDLQRSAMSLVNLVSDVLDITRMDTGKIELLESEFDLGLVITEECRQLSPIARQKHLELHCAPIDSALWVRSDRIKLARVLGNLITNAIKFTQRGQVHVNASRLSGGGVEIRVADTGSGIPAEHVGRIFDEFFQLTNPGRDSSSGSGLGLTICKRLIDAMGGTIEVQSVLGEGSTFIVTLPPSIVLPTSRVAMAAGEPATAKTSRAASRDDSVGGDGNGQS